MAMICNHCYFTIISKEHKEKCITINMFQINEYIIDQHTKNMMTYGLGGCTAIIMVFFSKDTNKPYKIIFGHHPDINIILLWYKSYYNLNFNIVTIIKHPGTFKKTSEYFSLVIDNEQYWKNNMNESNNKLILEAYTSIIQMDCNSNSSLYLQIHPKIKYSDIYGGYINIIPNILI